MYNIGDFVTIRSDLIAGKDYEGWVFAHGMEQYKGKTYEVILKLQNNNVENRHIYVLSGCRANTLINSDPMKDHWRFTDEMLEFAATIDTDNFEKILLE